ncbi:MAG: NADPH-dependent F420 reductase [Cytophagaceae bacterium]
MKIGIIGSGNMGRTLGLLWKEKGHDVFFGSRNPKTIDYLKSVCSDAKVGSIIEAVNFGDILMYNLRDVMPSEVAPREAWKRKIIIDVNNWSVPSDFNFPPVIKSHSSLYQEDVPDAYVIKAFNHLAQEVYYHSEDKMKQFNIAGFYAGDNVKAKEVVAGLIKDSGLNPVDCGGLNNARLLESYADLVRLLIAGQGMGPWFAVEAKVLPAAESCRFGERQMSEFR